MTKKILVLGTGFIGSEIAHRFSEDYEVTCIDHGRNFDVIKKQCSDLKLIKGDIYDENLILNESKNKDIVFYCIDTGGVQSCINFPEKYNDINTKEFSKLLDSISEPEQKHFFLFSSIFVYSDISGITEETIPHPETLYGQFRLKQEKLLEKSKMNFTILRTCNIFGYGHFLNLRNYGAIENFIQHVFSDGTITLHGDGTQMVDYLHKNELLYLLTILMKNPVERQTYNVSSGQRMTIFHVADIIKKISKQFFSKDVNIIKLDESVKIPNIPLVVPRKVTSDTNWKPLSDLTESIKEMMFEYSKHER